MQSWTQSDTPASLSDSCVIPDSPDEISAPWLTDVLRAGNVIADRTQVEHFETRAIADGSSFGGRVVRLHLRYDAHEPQAPATLIAKFTTSHARTREFVSAAKGYSKEVRFYRELAPTIGIGTPRCYFAHGDGERLCILLEDLAPATSPDRMTGLTVPQAEIVLEQLAALHARWWNRVDELKWLWPEPEFVRTVLDRYCAVLPNFLKRAGDTCPELTRAAKQLGILLSKGNLSRQLANFQRTTLTLAHNDLRIDNIFVPSTAGGRFALIDWQNVSVYPYGCIDVARTVALEMSTALRREHSDALLRHYHARLLSLGVRNYSFSALKRRYRQDHVAIVILCVLAIETLDFEGADRNVMPVAYGQHVNAALVDARLSSMLAAGIVVVTIVGWVQSVFATAGRWLGAKRQNAT